jgi:hypothetical protein
MTGVILNNHKFNSEVSSLHFVTKLCSFTAICSTFFTINMSCLSHSAAHFSQIIAHSLQIALALSLSKVIYFHSPSLALLDILLMVVIIIFTIYSFSNFSKSAAYLIVPYIAWVSFAPILKFTIWNLNK